MTQNKSVFSQEYTVGQQTKVNIPPTVTQGPSIPEIKVEDKRYGLGKPKRVLIRALLTND
jgi:hypothetical protein